MIRSYHFSGILFLVTLGVMTYMTLVEPKLTIPFIQVCFIFMFLILMEMYKSDDILIKKPKILRISNDIQDVIRLIDKSSKKSDSDLEYLNHLIKKRDKLLEKSLINKLLYKCFSTKV